MSGAERIDLTFATGQALKQLEEIARKLDDVKKSASSVSFGQGANLASAAIGGSATGSAIASFAASSPIDKLVTLVELAVRTHFPALVAKLDYIGRAQGASAMVTPIVEQASRLGIKMSQQQVETLVGQAYASEGRAQVGRARVDSAVKRLVGEQVAEDSGLQGVLDKMVGPRDVTPRNR